MTRAELRARMSAKELDEWLIFARQHGMPDARSDERHGVLTAIVASIFAREPRKPWEFMLGGVAHERGRLRAKLHAARSGGGELAQKIRHVIAIAGEAAKRAASRNTPPGGAS